jgi:predicted RNA-binding protein with PUA-like domain
MKEEKKVQYWLLKSECYTIDNLKKDKRTPWTGVRNYQARNFMRDLMKDGDMVLFYHSNAEPSGIYGLAKVKGKPHPDLTAFDKKDDHYDPKSDKNNPRWMLVDVVYQETFKHPVSLSALKFDPELAGMMVRERGSRLSVQPVSQKHFNHIVSLSKHAS